MNLQLLSCPFKMQLLVLVKKDASCLDPPRRGTQSNASHI